MRTEQRAREAFADGIAAQGPAWAAAAASVRAGYTNIWIHGAISALTTVLRLVPDDADEDPKGSRA